MEIMDYGYDHRSEGLHYSGTKGPLPHAILQSIQTGPLTSINCYLNWHGIVHINHSSTFAPVL